jgi:hypothetical protein
MQSAVTLAVDRLSGAVSGDVTQSDPRVPPGAPPERPDPSKPPPIEEPPRPIPVPPDPVPPDPVPPPIIEPPPPIVAATPDRG